MRTVLAVGAAALLLAGCGTTVPLARQGLSAGTSSLGGPAPSSSPAIGPGVAPVAPQAQRPGQAAALPAAPAGTATTAVSAPPAATLPGGSRAGLTVGVLSTNNDAASSAGVDNGNTFTPRKAYAALVAAWNARGGVAGRHVAAVYVELKSSSGNLSSDLQQACSTFTQDNHVDVVLSTIGVFDEGFTQCLARKGIPMISSDYALGDQQSLAQAATLVAPSTLTTDARMTTLLTHFTATGRLTRSSRLGVVVEGCPFNQRTYDRTVVPLAAHLGLTVAGHQETRCFHGIQDLGGQAADLQSIVLQFQSARVSDVLFVSGGFEGNLMLLFGTAAQSQQYHPKYDLTSVVSAVIQEGNTPTAQLQNAAGVGWLPTSDSDASAVPSAPQRQCLSDLRNGAAVAPHSAADRTYGYSACDAFSLLDRTLRLGGVLQGLQRLGDGFTSTMTYGGTTDFSGSRRTGPSTGREFAWQNGCSCFGYTGSTFALAS